MVVGGFKEELAADVRLVFFLPGIVYMADAVGTQTEALVIRGMSIGVTLRGIPRSELLTGGLIGIVLAGLALPALAVGRRRSSRRAHRARRHRTRTPS